MKKILLLFAMCFMLTPCIANAYSDVYSYDDYYSSVTRLGDMGIINGYEDGTFRPSECVTREEFSKMIVCAINTNDEANASGSFTCRFSDVENGRWSIPYINYISSNEIVKGYVDGSFGPKNNINYAEASTILCRLLGYNEDTLGYYWPYNYVTKANSLGFNFGISDDYAPLNRATIAKMLDTALFTEVNPNATSNNLFKYNKNTTLLAAAGYTVIEDSVVLANSSVDTSLQKGDVMLSNYSIYETKTSSEPYTVGTLIEYAVVNDDDEIIAVKGSSNSFQSMTVTISKVSGNEIEYISQYGSKNTIKLDSSFETYVDYEKTTFGMAKQSLQAGADITFYGEENGSWDFLVVDTLSEITPILATRNYTLADTDFEGITIDKENLIVHKNDSNSTLADVKINDVVYYNQNTNIMDVYNKKVTGIYYSAYPSKAYVTKVTVGGKEYELGSVSATGKLDASDGAYNIGDKVTLLLGKDNKVVFVKDISGFNDGEYGILLKSSVQIVETGDYAGKSEYVASILMGDGETYEYATDKDYKKYIGDLVKINAKDSNIALTKISAESSLSGEFNPIKLTLGNKQISKNVIIYQLLSCDDEKEATAEVLDINVLSTINVNSSNILNYVVDSDFGDIGVLYVKGFTDSAYKYGILTSRTIPENSESTETTYKITVNGSQNTYKSSGILSMSSGSGPVKFLANGTTISAISSLYKYASANAITALDETRIKLSGTTYDIATNVVIYKLTGTSNYSLLSFEELKNMKVKTISIYSDKAKSNNGEIKMIVVTE